MVMLHVELFFSALGGSSHAADRFGMVNVALPDVRYTRNARAAFRLTKGFTMQILGAQCQSIRGRSLKRACSPHFYPLSNMAKFNDIQLLRTTFLRGPSVWTYLCWGSGWIWKLEGLPSNKIPGLNDRLTPGCPT